MRQVFCYFMLLGCLTFGFSQDDLISDYIDSYEDYNAMPREIIYAHLNKSTYIQGEMLGFKLYGFTKNNLLPAENTSNVYCQIINADKKIVKEKLVMLTQGVSRNDFMLDSTFISGEYTFKAFTNWMRNFNDEPNAFSQKFRVINPLQEVVVKPESLKGSIDLQILPESGHLLANTSNTVGLIAKDENGLGVKYLKIAVLDQNDNLISECQLNQFGIGRIILNPKNKDIFKFKFTYNDVEIIEVVDIVEEKGILLSLSKLPSRSAFSLTLKTNSATMVDSGDDIYSVLIHNGNEMKGFKANFNGNLEVNKILNETVLFPGINIITLMNEDDDPIAERMVFNYHGIKKKEIKHYTQVADSDTDSLTIEVPLANIDTSKFQSLSISVLPSATKSYAHHENIMSAVYLRPHLKSSVENASYYFDNISPEIELNMDNLLLTQGWSIYDWNDIFNNSPQSLFNFETGINYTINNASGSAKNILIYPNINTGTEFLEFKAGQASVMRKGFFPLENEQLRIGEIKSGGKMDKSSLTLQFQPSIIPQFNDYYKPLSTIRGLQSSNSVLGEELFEKIEVLDEVKLIARKKLTRIEKIQRKTLGKITEFGEEERQFYRTFAQFISARGYLVDETPAVDPVTDRYSIFRIESRQTNTINGTNIPVIFLDDAFLVDYDILNNFSMRWVDYVEVNKGGVGEGLRGGAGVIRIYTDPNKQFEKKVRDGFTSYDLPLVFSTPKRFYIPKYNNFESDFFKEYGLVEWLSNVTVGLNSAISFKIQDTKHPVVLFVEGLVNGDTFISSKVLVK